MGFKAEFSAQRLDFPADCRDDLPQPVCSKMRALFVQNRRIGAGGDEFLEYFSNTRVADPGRQFAVGESPCAAFQ